GERIPTFGPEFKDVLDELFGVPEDDTEEMARQATRALQAISKYSSHNHIEDIARDSVALLRAACNGDYDGMGAIIGNTECQECLARGITALAFNLITFDPTAQQSIPERREWLDGELARRQ